MNSRREAILLGTRGAVETHTGFRIQQRIEATGGSIDVFGTIAEVGVPLLFRPLDGLLGACVRLPNVGAGILVTTRRDLHMQRFTAAHELGHFVLEHEGRLDRVGDIGFPGQTKTRDLKEIAADAFAAEFLMPRWLFIHHARRRGWTTTKLSDPLVAYQLSLRMAVSYDATCLGLLSHKILDGGTVEKLRAAAPKNAKKQALGSVDLDDSWANVWMLDEHDDGSVIEAGPRDIFIATLHEHSGSGYLWDSGALENAGFTIVEDHREEEHGEAVGAHTRRRLVLKVGRLPGVHKLGLLERRPWESKGSPLNSITVSVSTFGAEIEGLPRRLRAALEQPSVH